MNQRQKTTLAGGLGLLAAATWVPQILPMSPDAAPPMESPAEAGPTPAASTNIAVPSVESQTALGEPEVLLLGEEELEPEEGEVDWSAFFAELDPETNTNETPTPLHEANDENLLLADFAERNPLTGLIVGPDRALALLGHRVVAAGNSLEGGRISVLSIGVGWVEIGCGEARLRQELPAFHASGSPPLPSPAKELPQPPRNQEAAASGGDA